MKENKNPKKQKAGTGMIFEKTKYIKSKFTNGDDLPILKEDQPSVQENNTEIKMTLDVISIIKGMK